MSHVDLIHDQKSKLFGAVTSIQTFVERTKSGKKISGRLSELHGNVRTRDDIMKNTIIYCSKLASARKTGGGRADADINEIEAKISSIKGKEAFEGIESQSSNDETTRMLMRPVPSEDIEELLIFQ
ncbi:hypothetical protein LOD99_14573 [Oopsacas minuta]|uniref:Uncharacterized protein n=1 Tax=Oopsacas minuta TaxID=111878 RepID=A0AAV7KG41_9METZ|nr:hypothetical protein LOD99_14573 [Oopsacas minuta]